MKNFLLLADFLRSRIRALAARCGLHSEPEPVQLHLRLDDPISPGPRRVMTAPFQKRSKVWRDVSGRNPSRH